MLCLEMGIQFVVRPLEVSPFWHGYGPQCSDARLTFAMWDLVVTDLGGMRVKLPFFITTGSGFLLLSNDIVHALDLMN